MYILPGIMRGMQSCATCCSREREREREERERERESFIWTRSIVCHAEPREEGEGYREREETTLAFRSKKHLFVQNSKMF
jgi:hypothetical protein